MKTQAITLLQFFSLLLIFPIYTTAQSPPIVRVDGVGAGNQFLKIDEGTKSKILDGTYDGEINYLSGHGPFEIEYMPTGPVIGEYEITLIDDNLSDDELGPEIFWSITNLNTGQTLVSNISILDMPEQEVPEFGIIIKVAQTDDAGQLGSNNGAIGYELNYKNPSGPQWLNWIPDDHIPDHLNYIQTAPGELDNQFDPEEKLTDVSDGLFYPYQLLSSHYSAGTPSTLLSPIWLNTATPLISDIERLSNLKNIDIVFTADKNLWSRCVILDSATPAYYREEVPFLGLSTAYDESYDCMVEHYDLRGDYSVGKEDTDGDGLPDLDGETDFEGEAKIGMGWFPGYAIDVENGKRLNIFFAENSAYSLDQDPVLLSEYDISADDFNGPPTGRDMMWNPTNEELIEAGSSAGFPYQQYMGGQHYIYVTEEEYDGCEYMYERLRCIKSTLQKVNAIRRILWVSFPIVAEGESLLSYNDGLIPNELTISLRVDNPFQVETGTGTHNGYPAYRFEINASSADGLSPLLIDAIQISPNPYVSNSNQSLVLSEIKEDIEVSVLDVNGKLIHRFEIKTSEASGGKFNLKNKLHSSLAQGTYFLQIRNKAGFGKMLKLVVL